MPTTLQRPNSFFKAYSAAASTGFLFGNDADASVTEFVGVYPVPKIEFSLRESDWPSRPIKSAANQWVEVALHLHIVLLD